MSSSKRIYWIIAPAAAGKSTMVNQLKAGDSEGKTLFLSDLDEMVDLLKNDIEEKRHRRLDGDRFRVTDPEVYNEAVINIGEKILADEEHEVVVAEIACGEDVEGKFDLSVKGRLDLLPKEVLRESMFIYINTGVEMRRDLNLERKGVSRTPPEVFEGMFLRDDFVETMEERRYPYVVLENSGDQQVFLATVDSLSL